MVAILGLGLFQVIRRYKIVSNRIKFTKEYLNRFNKFIERPEFDGAEYYWLTHRVAKIQNELGQGGILASYKPPFANFIYSNYQLIINTLPEIRSGKAHTEMVSACQDAMIRHLGMLDDRLSKSYGHLFNPVKWLQEGIRLIISFPIRLAYWSSLFQYADFERIVNGPILSFLSFIVMLIGLLGSVITLALGWDNFLKLLRQWTM